MKKRLIALMLACVTVTGSLVGCSSCEALSDEEKTSVLNLDETDEFGRYVYQNARINDKHISVDQKGKFVLHKGDVIYYENPVYTYTSSIDINKMKFDCGKELHTNATYYVSDEMPSEDLYDSICEDCFNVNQ